MIEGRKLSRALRLGLLVGSSLTATGAWAQSASAPPASLQPPGAPGATPAQVERDAAATGQDAVAATRSDSAVPIQAPQAAQSDIVVTGIRRSLEDALQTKRRSNQVIDSISAEGIGKLPDLNLSESLQRLPGVQINRSAQRRLGTVSIRGLPGDFSQTLIDGMYLASPDVSNFSFGTVRSEVFSGVDVIKANDAADLTGGLSGLVNLRTGSPLEARDQLSISVDGKYEELTGNFAPGGALVVNRTLIPGVLAVRAALGYQKLDFREDNAQINTYDRTAGAATTDLSDDVYAPRQTRLATNDTRGDAYSGAVTVAWKPTSSLTATLRGFFNDYEPEAYTSQFTIDTTAGRTTRTPIGGAVNEGAFGQTFNHVLLTNPLLITDSRILDDRYRTYATSGNLRFEQGGWLVDGTVHYTRGQRFRANYGFQAQQQAAVSPGSNGLVVEINTGAGDLGHFLYDLQSGSPRLNLQQAFGAPLAPTFRQVNATANPLQNFIGGFRNEFESEDELAFSLDVKRNLDFGPIASVEAGGIYRDKKQNQRNSLQSLFGATLSAIGNSLYDFSFLNGSGAFLDGKAGMFDRADYAEIDVRRTLGLITPVTVTTLPANASIGPGGLVAIQDTTSISQTYDNAQKIYGGYGQVNLDQDIGADFHLRGNFGVRYEQSERSTIARTAQNQLSAPLAFRYHNWLPSVNLVIEGWDKLVLRGSYNKTLRRPQVDSFAVLRSIAVDGTGNLITVGLGAGDLRPFTSDNFDVSLEFYNRSGSSVSALVFQKNVHDYAGTTRICPADGGGFGFGPLSNASGVCRTTQATPASGLFPQVFLGATANINVTANQSDFMLKGLELSAQQSLSFLPAPLNGFGVQANYTYIDFSTSSTFRLSEISQDTVNAILYFETPVFSVRGAYVYRSGYFLGSGGTASGADRFVKSRSQLDLTASLNINSHLSASAEVFNVTNAQLYEYEGAVTRARNYTVYGRTAQLGMTYRF